MVMHFIWKKMLIGRDLPMCCVPCTLIGWLPPVNFEPLWSKTDATPGSNAIHRIVLYVLMCREYTGFYKTFNLTEIGKRCQKQRSQTEEELPVLEI